MNLDHQKLDQLPPLPTRTSKLSVCFNALQNVDQLAQLDRLEELRLQNNFLTRLPPLSKRLTHLILKNNFLRDLPDLDQLQIAQLDNNEFRRLPETLDRCTQLRQLSINSNRLVITEFPNWPLLRDLSLDQNGLTCLPAIGHLINLQTLSLSHNNLQDLGEIGQLANLTSLTLSYNKIIQASSLGDCPLSKLWLNSNCLQEVRGLPQSLQYLYLQDNQLIEIKLDLPVLKKLRIDNNHLESLDCRRMPALQQLCACRNQLSAIKFGSAVRQVLLSSNRFSKLPVIKSSQISVLSLKHNKIHQLPLEIQYWDMDWLDLNFCNAIL